MQSVGGGGRGRAGRGPAAGGGAWEELVDDTEAVHYVQVLAEKPPAVVVRREDVVVWKVEERDVVRSLGHVSETGGGGSDTHCEPGVCM